MLLLVHGKVLKYHLTHLIDVFLQISLQKNHAMLYLMRSKTSSSEKDDFVKSGTIYFAISKNEFLNDLNALNLLVASSSGINNPPSLSQDLA